jgi:hypothetical protein
MAEVHIDYRGYNIGCQEPRLTSANWQANVASNDRDLYRRMCQKTGRQGAEVITGQTRDEMLSNAKAFIDGVLGNANLAERVA